LRNKLNLTKSEAAYERAMDLVPGAVLGIRRPYNFVPGEYPIFFAKARGGKVWDVDGNEYIDMLCAYGPIIIGHREEEIDEAVVRRMADGFCMSLTQPMQNELAEKMRQLIPCAEQSVFVKTGTDATTTAIRIARGHTDRLKVMRCGYHGWADWCVEVKGGVPEKFYEDVHEFHYNDLDELETLMKKHGDQTAAIIITPLGHPLALPVEYPKPGFLEGVRKLADRYGAVLIFDEIRTGFRVNLHGAQKEFGVTPDLAVFGKAMGNGYPISAVTGKREIMQVLVKKVFLSSTFFPNSLEQVAALKTIEILERDKVLDVIREKGQRFGKAVSDAIARSKVPCEMSGAPWMPFITFDKDDKGLYKELRNTFYSQLIRRGVFLQPYHHGYIAYRHTDQELDYAVRMIEESLGECASLL
jgi:glutamate-1-semialdehyde aminotransferase